MKNKQMKLLIALLFVHFFSAYALQLNGGGKDYVIHLSQQAPATEKFAAQELQQYFQKMSSVKLPIVTIVPAGKNAIYVGQSNEVKASLPQVDLTKMGPDQVIIKSIGDDIVVVGDAPRGTIYAADTLLEEGFGIKWWTSTAEFVPKNPTLELSAIDIDYTPSFLFRDSYNYDVKKNTLFAVHLKNNGQGENIPLNMGGHVRIIGWVHTFEKLISPKKYFKDHPEWFSLVDGKRSPKSQLCLTNKAMIAELVKNSKKWLRDNPTDKIISVSQNDINGGYCMCEECTKFAEKYGRSGLLIHFVNQVAEELEKDYPDVIVDTLAYYYTTDAPKTEIKPRHNVLVCFTPILADFGHPMNGSGVNNPNNDFADNLRKWHSMGANIAIWNYIANYLNYFIPHPNFRNLGSDLRFFRDNGAKIVFQEDGPNGSELSNFSPLRTWVVSKLLWNPELKTADLIDEFMKGYYGKAAPAVKESFELMMSSFETTGCSLSCFVTTCGWFPVEKITQARKIMSAAMNKTSNDTELMRRLRLVKATFDFAWLNSILASDLSSTEKQEALVTLAELKALAEKYHISHFNERMKKEIYFKKLENNIVKGIIDKKSDKVPAFCKDLPQDQWYEFSSEFMRLYFDGLFVGIWETPDAASGKSVWISAQKNKPYFQFQVPHGKWQILISMRAKKGDGSPTIFANAGFYNQLLSKGTNIKPLRLATFSGDSFVWQDLGVIDVTDGFVYIEPLGASNLKDFEAERIILINKADEKGFAEKK
ncbi:MAG: DUF4838 domain-containing protein [Lentisphaeria bacterium]